MRVFVCPLGVLAELVVVALAVAYVAWSLFGRQRFAVRFSNVELLDKVAPSRAGWRRHVVSGLFLLALAVMVVAVARPQTGSTVSPAPTVAGSHGSCSQYSTSRGAVRASSRANSSRGSVFTSAFLRTTGTGTTIANRSGGPS